MIAAAPEVEHGRARASAGATRRSTAPCGRLLAGRGASGNLADVGCGTGDLWRALAGTFTRCIGIDAVRYGGLPVDVDFRVADLDRTPLPIPDGSVDAAAAVEVIEHLDNPRALVRELRSDRAAGGLGCRHDPESAERAQSPDAGRQGALLRIPGCCVSSASHGAARNRSSPHHAECGCATGHRLHRRGRLPLTPWHYPTAIARLAPRRLSDNIVLIARR